MAEAEMAARQFSLAFQGFLFSSVQLRSLF